MQKREVSVMLMMNIMGECFIYLQDPHSGHGIPIFIGPYEESIVQQSSDGATPARPLCHDLFATLAQATESAIECATVTRVDKNIFYAEITVKAPQGLTNIDARPSDAISIALRSKVPIYVTEEVFRDAAAVINTDNMLQYLSNPQGPSGPPSPRPVSDEERKQLKPFDEALKDIDLSGFDDQPK